jgi:two-component system, sensor histidine kinase and response regulator
MRGKIWVESEAGQGSTFHFTSQFGLQTVFAARPDSSESIELENLSVLVVDDNATNRLILTEMLGNWGMKATAVDSARAALAELYRADDAGNPYLLVLLDCHMPEMDGFDLTREIKLHPELKKKAAIMMLTSGGGSDDIARCRQLGIDAYLLKPIKQSELFESILMVLDQNSPESVLDKNSRADAEEDSSLSQNYKRLEILLAEDNQINQTLAIRLLEKRGHRVVVANNGLEALQAVEKAEFDVVLMDVQMPVMSGFEAVAAIRDRESETGRHIPIIALTAHAMKGDQERCLQAGMDAYVSKPVQAEQLFQAIDNLTRTSDTGEKETVSPPAEAENLPGESAQPVSIDWAEVLEYLGGDEELLREIAVMFIEDCPSMLAKIKEASLRGDGKSLEQAAHALKGVIGNFSTETPAYHLAFKLEMMGRESELKNAAKMCERLEQELKQLTAAVESIAEEQLVGEF